MRRHLVLPFLLLLGILAVSFTAASAQSSVTIVPQGLSFTALTPDGQVALLHNYPTAETWLWTESGGLQFIGLAVAAQGLSADGQTVAGARDVGGTEIASRWTAATGWVDLGGLPGQTGCDAFLSSGFDVSGDGAVLVGLGWESCEGRAIRWTAATGVVELPQLGPNSARANKISRDGQVIGGFDEHAAGPRRPALWLADGSELLIAGSDSAGEVGALSADGSVAAGDANGRAFVWTAATGVVDLGLLPGGLGSDISAVYAMNGSGTMLGGNSGDGGPFGFGFFAFVWTEASGMEDLRARLVAEGAVIPDSFRLANVLAISDDGRTVAGWGEDVSGAWPVQHAFIARLAAPVWSVAAPSLAGALGAPVLTGSGPQIGGKLTTLKVTGGAPLAPAYVVAGGSQIDLPFKGGVLAPSPDLLGAIVLDDSGARQVDFRWPKGVPSGMAMTWQVWVADASGPAGFAATNALTSVAP